MAPAVREMRSFLNRAMFLGVVLASLFALSGLDPKTARAQQFGDVFTTLTVTPQPGGTVQGSGIDCGDDCSETYKIHWVRRCDVGEFPPCTGDPVYAEETVMVTAVPFTGWSFVAWGGECTHGQLTCRFSTCSDPDLCDPGYSLTTAWRDIGAPQVTLTAPAGGAAVRGTIMLSATAGDNDQVEKVTFFARDVTVGEDTTAPYAVGFNTSLVASGPAFIKARAVDRTGNATEDPVPVVIDNQPPTVVLSVPSPVRGTITLAATPSDNHEVARVEFFVRGVEVGEDTTAPYSVSFNTDDVPEGFADIKARAVDRAGNSGEDPKTVLIDREAPSVVVTAPANGASVEGIATLTAMALDNDQVARVEFNVGGVEVSEDASAPFAASVDTRMLSDGDVIVTARALDRVGNADLSAPILVKVDNIAPTVSLTAQPPALTNSARARFGFTSSEAAEFACTLDNQTSPCSAEAVYDPVADGPHTFSVRAIATAGLRRESAPVSWAWTVDTIAPDTTLDVGPRQDSTTPIGVAEFRFSSSEPQSTFRCRLEYEPWAVCSNPVIRIGIPTGLHTFEVQAVDSADNGDPSPASRRWLVNILDRDGDGHNGAPGPDCNDANPAIHPGAVDEPRNGVDEDCNGRDAGFVRVASRITWKLRASVSGHVSFTSLAVSPTRRGSTIELRCSGRGCPFQKPKRRRVTKDARRVSLLALVRRARLRPSARFEVRVTQPGVIGSVRQLRVRRKGRVQDTELCVIPGTVKPRLCDL